MKYEKINMDWNADPNTPEPIIWIENGVLKVDFFLNHFIYEHFNEGDRARLSFEDCSRYSFNSCNDEGYYRGQYRNNPIELPWGEFFKVISGLDNQIPEPNIFLMDKKNEQNHYIFFFRDNILELFAKEYVLEFLNESQIQFKLLQILWQIFRQIKNDSDTNIAGYKNYQHARQDVEELIEKIRKDDSSVMSDLDLRFAPSGKFQELSISNNWYDKFLNLAEQYNNYRVNTTQRTI
ncbi:MAG: hypothetical protein IT220_02565 [Flavobacteriaceae bacterium]|nr:hypothetical protein [Flavobacteriaceae bacterium]